MQTIKTQFPCFYNVREVGVATYALKWHPANIPASSILFNFSIVYYLLFYFRILFDSIRKV